jgi:uncharacterized protein (TIGR02246 family)
VKTFLAFCMIVFGSAIAFAQQQSDLTTERACKDKSAQRAAQNIVNTWIDGYNSGDAARVAALYVQDAYYLTQHYVTGIVQGRDRIQAYVQLGVDAHYHIDSIRILHVACDGGFMYVITRYEANNGGRKDFGVNLVVARKTRQGWRIAAHEAAVPDPATAVQQLDVPANTKK